MIKSDQQLKIFFENSNKLHNIFNANEEWITFKEYKENQKSTASLKDSVMLNSIIVPNTVSISSEKLVILRYFDFKASDIWDDYEKCYIPPNEYRPTNVKRLGLVPVMEQSFHDYYEENTCQLYLDQSFITEFDLIKKGTEWISPKFDNRIVVREQYSGIFYKIDIHVYFLKKFLIKNKLYLIQNKYEQSIEDICPSFPITNFRVTEKQNKYNEIEKSILGEMHKKVAMFASWKFNKIKY